MSSFTPAQLGLSQTEMDQLTSALANATITDPLGQAIAEALNKVEIYAGRYTLNDDHARRLVRPLVLFELYSRLNQVTDRLRQHYEEAMRELEALRQGRLDAPPAEGSSARGGWGGAENIFSQGTTP